MRAGWSSPGAGLAIVGTNLVAVVVDLPARVLLPATTYLSPIQKVLEGHPPAAIALRLGCSAVVILGVIRLARHDRGRARLVWFHSLATIILFLVWPWTMIMDRFLLGLFPLILLSSCAGIAELGRRAQAIGLISIPSSSRLALWTLVLTTIGIVSVTARAVHVFHTHGRQWPGASDRRSVSEMLSLIGTRLEPDAVIAARWPDTVFLHTGRLSVPLTEDDAILVGRYDRGDRLRLWMDQAPDRPFYLLIRGPLENPSLADRRQADALARTSGVELRPFLRTSDGRYELVRVSSG
jgi:hypothetical protein